MSRQCRLWSFFQCALDLRGGGRNRIGRREKWPKKSWEEGEIGGKSREEGEKKRLNFREEGEIGSKSREEGEIGSESREIYLPVPPPSQR